MWAKSLIVVMSIACVLLAVYNGAFFSTYKRKRAASVGLALIMLVLAGQQAYLAVSWLLHFQGIQVAGLWFDVPVVLMIELFLVVALMVLSSIILLGRKGG